MTEAAQNIQQSSSDHDRYARCIEVSKRIRWDIEQDVIRGRRFDTSKKFLPDGLSLADEVVFLSWSQKRLLSQIQGRTYANIFGLVERFINAKVLEVSRDHWLGDQTALEALVRFSDEELKHQEMFRRIDRMTGDVLPPGYEFVPRPDDVAAAVLSKSTWAVLGLTLHIELFTQEHYRQSIESDSDLSGLYKDVFLFHWREESQHAILDEIEWRKEDGKLSDEQRDLAVNDLIELVAAVDGILQAQAEADGRYFSSIVREVLDDRQREDVNRQILKAYRWQYIVSGIQGTRFTQVLGEFINSDQNNRINEALSPIM